MFHCLAEEKKIPLQTNTVNAGVGAGIFERASRGGGCHPQNALFFPFTAKCYDERGVPTPDPHPLWIRH